MNIIYIHTHDLGIYNQAYGYNVPTPNIYDFAKEGTLFRRNYCVNPTCSASRAAMLTGETPHQCGMTGLAHRGFSLNNPKKHLANFLKEHGYETVLCGVQHEIAQKGRYWETLGYEHFLQGKEEAKPFNGFVNQDMKNAEAVVEYIENRKKDKPLFLSFGMAGTHRKYIEADMGIDPNYISVPYPLYDMEDTRKDFAQFMASAKVMDYCAGLVFDALKRNGYQEDSFIFFTTDHGIAFPRMKCNLYDSGIHVSLIIQCPDNRLKGKAVDSLTSHLDIFPTVCDYAGLEKPDRLVGKSLMPLLQNQRDKVREEIFAEINYHAAYEPVRCIRTERFKYIKYYGTYEKIVAPNCDNGLTKRFMVNNGWLKEDHLREGLFDLYLDPGERVNLIDRPEYAEILQDLKNRLNEYMISTEDPLLKGDIPFPEGGKTDKIYKIGPDYRPKVSLIAAMSKNYVIGMDEKIPWRIPGEQKRFKELTMGKTIILGRKTHESIGRPLPGRKTIVISRSKNFDGPNCITVESLYDALLLAKDEEEVFIAGGGRVYEEALPFADCIYLTVIDREYDGNVFFPKFNMELFEKTYEERMEGEIPYTYYTLNRKNDRISCV